MPLARLPAIARQLAAGAVVRGLTAAARAMRRHEAAHGDVVLVLCPVLALDCFVIRFGARVRMRTKTGAGVGVGAKVRVWNG